MDDVAIERFWSKVTLGGLDDCWEWTAATANGYGRFWLEGRSVAAHRVAFFLAHGRWPEPLGLHRCDNRPCCNARHIWEGSTAENVADRCRKGRSASGERNGAHTHPESRARGERHYSRTHPELLARGATHGWRLHPQLIPRGEQNGNAQLTVMDVHAIRLMRGKATQKVIATMFRTSQANVSGILSGRIWRHV